MTHHAAALIYVKPVRHLCCGGILLAMFDRLLTAEAAQAFQDEADRDRTLLTWVVMEAEDSADIIARPTALGIGAQPYVLVAATLAELHSMLPGGLLRSPRQSGDPPGVLETWFRALRIRDGS